MPEQERAGSTDWAQGPRRRLGHLPNARAWDDQTGARAQLRVGDRQDEEPNVPKKGFGPPRATSSSPWRGHMPPGSA